MAKRVVAEVDKFLVRLPDGMREALQTAATANRRTMTGEIIARLEQSFADEAPKTAPRPASLADLNKKIEELERSLENLSVPDFLTAGRLDDVEARVRKLESRARK
jgi:septal ring factor EnvC (AmiA/AmiB activator)